MTGPTTQVCLKCLGASRESISSSLEGLEVLTVVTFIAERFETIQVSSLELADILTII
jgi:hypothetical protein